MFPLDLIKLTALMTRTKGSPEIKIGLIDGPVATADLAVEHVRHIHEHDGATCRQADSVACLHGTFVAGILSAKANSAGLAICPGCTLLIRPVFTETSPAPDRMPSTTPLDLAKAILDCIDAGARILNLSLGLAQPSSTGEKALEEALHQAVRRGVIIVAAAGNQGTIGSSAITRHPWVIPVVACDRGGRPVNDSNLGSSIGRGGLRAPGDRITSLSSEGQSLTLGGTSAAAPFVTGAAALLWSEFPSATAAQIKLALTQATVLPRRSIVPPLLDAAAAYQLLLEANERRQIA